MRISEARSQTGFEKCDFEDYDQSECESCGAVMNRNNSENYRRDCCEYDEGVYACNKCVKAEAKNKDLKHDIYTY